MEEKIEYTDTINYVVTTQPDLVAGYIDELNERIAELEQDLKFTTKTANELIEIKHKLEQELAEVKENAIVPKYLLGQEVYTIYNGKIITGRIYEIQTNAVLHDKENLITYLVDFYSKYEDDEQDNDYFEEEDLFATEQEAQAKLKEIQGNE